MSDEIDLDYRPDDYFRPPALETALLAKVKGAVLRKRLQAMFQDGRHAEAIELLSGDGISSANNKALESIHPMFMGGSYLPDTEDCEVEIARISLESTTFDVICVYARPDNGSIRTVAFCGASFAAWRCRKPGGNGCEGCERRGKKTARVSFFLLSEYLC